MAEFITRTCLYSIVKVSGVSVNDENKMVMDEKPRKYMVPGYNLTEAEIREYIKTVNNDKYTPIIIEIESIEGDLREMATDYYINHSNVRRKLTAEEVNKIVNKGNE